MGPAAMHAVGGRRPAVLLMLALLATAGCGYRRPSLVRTQAVVTLDGEPVAGASVMLVPVNAGRPISGLSDDAGRLVFSTYGSRDGVPPGSYRAVVSKLVLTARAARVAEALKSQRAADDDATESMVEFKDSDYRNLLPARYASHETSDLAVTIERGTRHIALELQSDQTGQ